MGLGLGEGLSKTHSRGTLGMKESPDFGTWAEISPNDDQDENAAAAMGQPCLPNVFNLSKNYAHG